MHGRRATKTHDTVDSQYLTVMVIPRLMERQGISNGLADIPAKRESRSILVHHEKSPQKINIIQLLTL